MTLLDVVVARVVVIDEDMGVSDVDRVPVDESEVEDEVELTVLETLDEGVEEDEELELELELELLVLKILELELDIASILLYSDSKDEPPH